MTPADFAQWRTLMNLSRIEAARALGVGRNMPQKYEDGVSTIPLYIALACAALARGIKPWPL